MQSIHKKILRRIYGGGRGRVYCPKDFKDLGSRAAIDQTMSRLAEAKTIRRIGRGLYDYPAYSAALKDYRSPDAGQIASAEARKKNRSISMTPPLAANELGLSEQVPARPAFLTEGRTKEIKLGSRTIQLKHGRTSIDDERLARIYQAVRYLGKKGMDERSRSLLRAAINRADLDKLLRQTQYDVSWIHDALKSL